MTHCPTCRDRPLDLGNLLDGSASEQRVCAGVDTEAWCWTFRLWCEGCRSVLELGPDFGGGSTIRPLAKTGEKVAALKRRLERAREKGKLPGSALHLLRSADGYLLATPDLRPFVAPAFGERFALLQDAALDPAPGREVVAELADEVTPPDELVGLGEGKAPAPEVLPPKGAPGGLIRALPVRFQPSGGLRARRPAVLLAGSRLSLLGVWGNTLRFAPPPWAKLERELRARPSLVEAIDG
jgi:hypothetical protein